MTKEIRANKLEQGDVYREFGDDETRVIKDIDWHGDRVLITTDEELETSHDTDEVVELVTRLDRGVLPRTCQHCERTVYRNFDLSWIDPEAGYDDVRLIAANGRLAALPKGARTRGYALSGGSVLFRPASDA